jgi:hypothetical protein
MKHNKYTKIKLYVYGWWVMLKWFYDVLFEDIFLEMILYNKTLKKLRIY